MTLSEEVKDFEGFVKIAELTDAIAAAKDTASTAISKPETLPPIARTAEVQFVVLRREPTGFSNTGPAIQLFNTLEEAQTERAAKAGQFHGQKFCVFEMVEEEVVLPVSVIGKVEE